MLMLFDSCGNCDKTGHNTLLCFTAQTNTVVSESLPVIPTTSQHTKSSTSGHTTQKRRQGICAIYSVPIIGSKRPCTVFTDDGSDTSYITDAAAKKLGAKKLQKYILQMKVTGDKIITTESQEYELKVRTKNCNSKNVQYGKNNQQAIQT